MLIAKNYHLIAPTFILGNLNVVMILVKSGIDTNTRAKGSAKDGFTAMFYAIGRGND